MTLPTWFSQAIAQQPEHSVFDDAGARIALRSWGPPDAPLTLFLHGGGAHGGWWDHIAPFLVRDRRAVAIDFSGHGDSDTRETYSMDAWADELIRVGTALSPDGTFAVVGHSMGAIAGLIALSRAPEVITSAAAVDPAVRTPDVEGQALRKRFAAAPPKVYDDYEVAVARWHPSPNQDFLAFVGEHIARQSLRAVDGGWMWKFDARAFERPKTTLDRFDRVARPAVIVRAEHGLLAPTMAPGVLDRLGPHARLVELPGASHHTMLREPLTLIAALNAWQAGLSAGTATSDSLAAVMASR